MAELSVDAAYGVSHPRRSDGVGSSDYPTLELSLNVLHRFDWDGSLVLGAGYNRLSGGAEVLGSYRDFFFARIGYRQPFLRYLYASAAVGTGYSDSHINSGEGTVPLPDDAIMPVVFSARVGAEYCFGRHPCVGAFVQPAYERSVAGGPAYSDFPVLGGLEARFDLGQTVSRDEYDAMARAREEEERRRRHLEEEKASLVDQRDRLAVEVASSTRCPDQPIVDEPPPPADRPVGVSPTSAAVSCVALLLRNPISEAIILFPNEVTRLTLGEDFLRGDPIDRQHPYLEPVVRYLKAHPEIGVRIHGHANDTGPEGQHREISRKRGEAVAAYLRRRGVSGRQIGDVVPHGSSQPLNPDDPADTINRAVTLEEVSLQ